MNFAIFLMQMQSIRDLLPASAAPVPAAVVFVEPAAPLCGNGLFPRPCHDTTVNNGCSEHDIEAPELDNDGRPCMRVLP